LEDSKQTRFEGISGGIFMSRFQSYIDLMIKDINYSEKVKKELSEELELHLEMLLHEYLDKGYSLDEAMKYAVTDFGNPQVIGKELKRTLIGGNIVKQKMSYILFILNYLATIITLGFSTIVLFGDYIFNESVAETAKPYVPFFWIAFILALVSLYYSLPKQLNVHSKVSGWISIILGFWCIGGAIHDWANGFTNGDNPLISLFIPGFIFTFTGVLCFILLKEKKLM
jgi:hypothetical protein